MEPQSTAKSATVTSVVVYGASSLHLDEAYYKDAEVLGTLLAEHRIHLINGGGCMGLMNSVSNACLAAGGTVTGVIPEFMVKEGWQHTGLTELLVTKDMHSRKEKMAELSDAAIALPGGCGTFDELMEIITWKQLGIYPKPVVILNTKGYYNPLLQMLQRSVDEQFMRPVHADIWRVASTPQEAVELLFENTAQTFSKL
jgi:uncharacterized protein (TIGR00730 family)